MLEMLVGLSCLCLKPGQDVCRYCEAVLGKRQVTPLDVEHVVGFW